MTYDITMIGHISKDVMIYPEEEQRFIGGPVIYSSIAATRSGKRIHVITKCSEKDKAALCGMEAEGVKVSWLASPDTTSIENIYLSDDRERRKVRLLSKASSFSLEELPEAGSLIFHLAGLFKDEIPDAIIPHLAKKGSVGVDAQGLLRCNEKGALFFKNWENAHQLMPHISYFKADAMEAEILTGTSDRKDAARILADMGAKEIVITHHDGVLVLVNGEFFYAPYTAANLSGRTGRGDTTFAAYMAVRLDSDPSWATAYAAALCSMKMEAPGPFSGTEEMVYERMKHMGFSRESQEK
ncbi:PfkB family carbohydrate kinase [Sediminispirochaeta bajacaliforniensis]|uniref:PfkB family carbohydrate kinase n=1 Tax=Sediminispirochaeta bajacaliforniensis TaxID=148 RepID=UPI0003753708|nr:PfkB family carbohydrate kinase [Sediminispirochaeta bajacaliforniensis]